MKTKSYTATGYGVSIRPLGSPDLPPRPPRNFIETAAREDDITDAISTIAAALIITDFRIARANLSEAARWRRLPVPARLAEIAGWLTAECFDLMDLVESPHVDTLGD